MPRPRPGIDRLADPRAGTKKGKEMKRLFVTVAAAFAALSIGLAASAGAAPSGPTYPPQPPGHQTGGDAHSWFSPQGQNAFGWYQNDTKRESPARR